MRAYKKHRIYTIASGCLWPIVYDVYAALCYAVVVLDDYQCYFAWTHCPYIRYEEHSHTHTHLLLILLQRFCKYTFCHRSMYTLHWKNKRKTVLPDFVYKYTLRLFIWMMVCRNGWHACVHLVFAHHHCV